MEALDCSSTERNQGFEDMKEMFLANGTFLSLEHNLNRGLQRILK